jgi:hypothetical protein
MWLKDQVYKELGEGGCQIIIKIVDVFYGSSKARKGRTTHCGVQFFFLLRFREKINARTEPPK